MADSIGKIEKEKFISDIIMKGKGYFDPIKRQKLKKNGHNEQKKCSKKEKNKLTVIKHQHDMIMKILLASQENKIDLDLEELINFPLISVPFSLGTADRLIPRNALFYK